jgi:hypothetical protein
MGPHRKLTARSWLLVGIPLLFGLAMTGNRDLVEQAIGGLAVCDGLLRLYSLAINERDVLSMSSRRAAALTGVSTVLLGACFISLKSAVGMILLGASAIVPLAAWLFQKAFGGNLPNSKLASATAKNSSR